MSDTEKISKIREILLEKDCLSDSQEFGLHYGQIQNYLDRIEEIIKL